MSARRKTLEVQRVRNSFIHGTRELVTEKKSRQASSFRRDHRCRRPAPTLPPPETSAGLLPSHRCCFCRLRFRRFHLPRAWWKFSHHARRLLVLGRRPRYVGKQLRHRRLPWPESRVELAENQGRGRLAVVLRAPLRACTHGCTRRGDRAQSTPQNERGAKPIKNQKRAIFFAPKLTCC